MRFYQITLSYNELGYRLKLNGGLKMQNKEEKICLLCGGGMKEYVTRFKCRKCHNEVAKDGISKVLMNNSPKKHSENLSCVANVMPCVPYQVCPKCNGQGQVTKPPYIAGDQNTWSSSSAISQCDVCNGQKIIPMFILSSEPEVIITTQENGSKA